MLRKLILTLLLWIVPISIWAVGLGQLEVLSGLNQPLRARIPLLLSPSEQLEDIQLQLASDTDFAQYAIPKPTYLNELQFKVTEVNQQPFIQITTKRAVKDAAWYFLLQIDSPAGHLVHAYTLLLDPATQAIGTTEQQEPIGTAQQQAEIDIQLLPQTLATAEHDLAQSKQAYAKLKLANDQTLTELADLQNKQAALEQELQIKTEQLDAAKKQFMLLQKQVAANTQPRIVQQESARDSKQSGMLWLLILIGLASGLMYLVKSGRIKMPASMTYHKLELSAFFAEILAKIRPIAKNFQPNHGSALEPTEEIAIAKFQEQPATEIQQPIQETAQPIDVLEEAEIYFIYERYEQARKVLLSAIKKQPERTELKLKLLGVYAAIHDKPAFETLANQLRATLTEHESEIWQTVQALHRKTWPEQYDSDDSIKEEEASSFTTDGDLPLAQEANEILLSDEDVMGTKLEMARSCLEIGAIEDAKKILLDVQKFGDEAQRTEAERLLQRLT